MYDCLVIGLGGCGSSALFHLARRGLSVLGIEQYQPVHDRGSSHGEFRVIRKAYFEHPDYVPLLHRAYTLWQELERDWGRPLYHETGVLLVGPPDGHAIAGSLRSARQHDLPVEQLSFEEIAERYPLLRPQPGHVGLLEPEAGYLRVEDCVRAHLDLATEEGADARFNETVTGWEQEGDIVRVTTDRDTYLARSLVVAGGAWAGRLLQQSLPKIDVLRKLQYWHAVDSSRLHELPHLPTFYFDLPEGAFYGVPSTEEGTIKLARHCGGEPVADPTTMDRTDGDGERSEVERFLATHLPAVAPRAKRHSVCMYSISPDGQFLLGPLGEGDRIFVAAGLSGHGFKFTSVIGEALADLVADGRSSDPVDFLGLHRFAPTS